MGTRLRYGPRFGTMVAGGYCGGLPDPGDRKRYRKMMYAKAILKRKASEGDEGAMLRLIRWKQSTHLSQAAARETAARKRPPKPEVAKPGHTRLTRRDPDTGEFNTVELPAYKKVLDRLMRKLDGNVMGIVKHSLEPWQVEFLLTGRYHPEEA